MDLLDTLFPAGLADADFCTAIEQAGAAVPGRDALIELVGCCAWDIVSHNHHVIAPNGERLSLGSFREAGDALADLADRHSPADSPGWGYMDFYLGTRWPRPPEDVAPVYHAIYKVIFARIRAAGLTWRYYNPRGTVMELPPGGGAELPATALLQQALDKAYAQAYGPPGAEPLPMVAAYRVVFGADPEVVSQES